MVLQRLELLSGQRGCSRASCGMAGMRMLSRDKGVVPEGLEREAKLMPDWAQVLRFED